jgi:transcriptional regulator with XRE-family HTH domain
VWTLSSAIAKGNGRMEKSIYTDVYAVVLRLLKDAREKAGITQVDLAKRLGQTQSFVSKIERGDRRLDIVQLRTLCQVYGITLADFVERMESELKSE